MAKLIFDNFSDIYAFRAAITSRPNNGKCGNDSRNAEADFAGMPYEQALDCLVKGLPEQNERFKDVLRKFSAQTARTNKNRPINYYNGYAPNVPAAIIGLPKSMRKVQKTPQKTKVVTLIYSMGALGSVPAEDITESGITALKLVIALEKSGYRVNLFACPSMAKAGGEIAACVIKLKDAKQPLDIGKISFTMGNVSMFRRLGFAWRETVPGLMSGEWRCGYGSTIYDHETALENLQKMGMKTQNTYYFNVADCRRAKFDYLRVAKSIGLKELGTAGK